MGSDRSSGNDRESKLAEATLHVADGKRVVVDQRARIARLKGLGRDTFEAEMLLDQFEKTLAIFEADLRALQDDQNAS